MKRDPLLYIDDILGSIEKIGKYVDGFSHAQFLENAMIQDAVIRNFEIIGEAAKKIPQEIVGAYPDMPWSDAAGMRDVMIHDYPNIMLEEVWKTVQTNLQPFREQLLKVKHDLESKGY